MRNLNKAKDTRDQILEISPLFEGFVNKIKLQDAHMRKKKSSPHNREYNLNTLEKREELDIIKSLCMNSELATEKETYFVRIRVERRCRLKIQSNLIIQ